MLGELLLKRRSVGEYIYNNVRARGWEERRRWGVMHTLFACCGDVVGRCLPYYR